LSGPALGRRARRAHRRAPAAAGQARTRPRRLHPPASADGGGAALGRGGARLHAAAARHPVRGALPSSAAAASPCSAGMQGGLSCTDPNMAGMRTTSTCTTSSSPRPPAPMAAARCACRSR
jgi:hypothetical protein